MLQSARFVLFRGLKCVHFHRSCFCFQYILRAYIVLPRASCRSSTTLMASVVRFGTCHRTLSTCLTSPLLGLRASSEMWSCRRPKFWACRAEALWIAGAVTQPRMSFLAGPFAAKTFGSPPLTRSVKNLDNRGTHFVSTISKMFL